MKVRCLFVGMLLIASVLGATKVLHAQTYPSGGAAYYYFARPGDLTMLVSIWGTVRFPGQYEVAQTTDLGQLLSLAGGPVLVSEQSGSEHRVTVRISRQFDEGRRVVYEALYDSLVVSPEPFPRLQEGDVVTVEATIHHRFNWRDAITIVGVLATLALAIERLTVVAR